MDAANAKNGGQLTLSDETAGIPGGFILRNGSIEVNCAYDTLIRLQKTGNGGTGGPAAVRLRGEDALAKIKDTDYLAISARVRAMETTLLTEARMDRLLEARSDEEVSKLLQECGYPALDAARPEEMDAALSQAREELLADLSDSAPDPRYIDIFKLKYDYHNTKAILKAAAVGASRSGC